MQPHSSSHNWKINTSTNKNQVQSRKFNIANLTRIVSTPVFRGSVWKLCAHLFTGVFELFQRRKCSNFQEMLFKINTPLASSRRGSKYTLRNWLGSVAIRKTRISIRHASIDAEGQSSVERTAVPYRSVTKTKPKTRLSFRDYEN